MQQLGGIAIVLEPGKDAWGVEFNPGVVMDGEAEEHIAEVAGVLSRYVDLIGIRAFPKFQDWDLDRTDYVIKALAQHASVPVINMETIVHPCQELALMQTLQERLGSVANKKLVLTWIGVLFQLAWRLGTVSSRVISLVVYWSAYGW